MGKEDLNRLSEWIKCKRCMLKSRIERLRGMKTNHPSVFSNSEVKKKELDRLHTQYALVPVGKAGNNIYIVFARFNLNCILEELGLNSTSGIQSYTHNSLSKKEIFKNHMPFLKFSYIPNDQHEFELPYLYGCQTFIKTLTNKDT